MRWITIESKRINADHIVSYGVEDGDTYINFSNGTQTRYPGPGKAAEIDRQVGFKPLPPANGAARQLPAEVREYIDKLKARKEGCDNEPIPF